MSTGGGVDGRTDPGGASSDDQDVERLLAFECGFQVGATIHLVFHTPGFAAFHGAIPLISKSRDFGSVFGRLKHSVGILLG